MKVKKDYINMPLTFDEIRAIEDTMNPDLILKNKMDLCWQSRRAIELQEKLELEMNKDQQENKPARGWVKIRDISTDTLEVHSSKSKCEWSCEYDHHCEGVQEVEIRTVSQESETIESMSELWECVESALEDWHDTDQSPSTKTNAIIKIENALVRAQKNLHETSKRSAGIVDRT